MNAPACEPTGLRLPVSCTGDQHALRREITSAFRLLALLALPNDSNVDVRRMDATLLRIKTRDGGPSIRLHVAERMRVEKQLRRLVNDADPRMRYRAVERMSADD